MQLPEQFKKVMAQTLGEAYAGYIRALEQPPFRGLRINTLKADAEQVLLKLALQTKRTPFCTDGYYIDSNLSGLGNHPLHHAGAFYLQEPSAMAAVTALAPQPGERILDLCAAPGGKATQIAAAMQQTGVLVANEVIPGRARTLCANMERLGVSNAIVTNADPQTLGRALPGYFDRILVDAPCSGEGMIRRQPQVLEQWSEKNRLSCQQRQLHILNEADQMLRPGGCMVYSTCTLSGEENEQVIAMFLQMHPDYQLVPIQQPFGRPAFDRLCKEPSIVLARRILPQDGGEGHFVAKLQKTDRQRENVHDLHAWPASGLLKSSSGELHLFWDFYHTYFSDEPAHIVEIDGRVLLLPEQMPALPGVHVLAAGIEAGKIVGKRFVPAHGLYMAKRSVQTLELSLQDKRIFRFLRGEELDCDYNGYCGVAVEGICVGFGKASNGHLKNHYPKGLRIIGGR